MSLKYWGGVVCLLLSACSIPPIQKPPPDKPAKTTSTPPSTVANTPPSTAPAVPAKTSKLGGYYDKDGPPDLTPADLAAIPDAVPRNDPLRAAANRPYWLFGQLYTPMTAIATFKQAGIASWYGKQFHGRQTSTGEIYDMFAMTAAHPTLPLPSYVRVTNTKNGKQVVVRVNDRGPFLQNRAIDLSYAAATKLDYINSGHTTVEIELLLPDALLAGASRPASAVNDPIEALVKQAMSGTSVIAEPSELVLPQTNNANPAIATGQAVFLQLGAFTSRDAADNALRHAQRVLPEFENRLVLVDGNNLIRLRLGPFDSGAAATVAADQVAQSTGFKPVRVLQKR